MLAMLLTGSKPSVSKSTVIEGQGPRGVVFSGGGLFLGEGCFLRMLKLDGGDRKKDIGHMTIESNGCQKRPQ
jgi:hypothetical protein